MNMTLFLFSVGTIVKGPPKPLGPLSIRIALNSAILFSFQPDLYRIFNLMFYLPNNYEYQCRLIFNPDRM